MIKSNRSKPPKSDIKRDSFKWGNVRIGLKYSTVFIVAALLFIVAGGIVYLQLHEGQQEVKAIEEHSTRVNDMAHLESLIQIKDVQVSDYVLTKNEKYIDSYTVYQKEFDNLAEKLTPTMNTEEQIKILDEIKKSSTNMNDNFVKDMVGASVGEITTIVNNIQNETDHVVDSLNAGYGEVQEGAIQIKATGDNFKRINNSVSDMADKIGIISTNLEGISRNSNNMNNLIEEIASVSEESAAGVEQTAASVQQTASSMEEVSYSSRELAGLAEQLNEELKVFTL